MNNLILGARKQRIMSVRTISLSFLVAIRYRRYVVTITEITVSIEKKVYRLLYPFFFINIAFRQYNYRVNFRYELNTLYSVRRYRRRTN